MPIPKRFREKWESIDDNDYDIGVEDSLISQALDAVKSEVLTFVLNRLKVQLQ